MSDTKCASCDKPATVDAQTARFEAQTAKLTEKLTLRFGAMAVTAINFLAALCIAAIVSYWL